MKIPTHILPVIVVAQFFCTSLWFATNGVMGGLVQSFDLLATDIGPLTAAIQFGFICGTLVYALLGISDKYSPSRVFFISAILACIFNLGIVWQQNTFESLLGFRFAAGFFLAGIYPVGMKIASDYYHKGLGKSLGYLLGALVLGTALPHLLNEYFIQYSWKAVIYTTTALAIFGGSLVILLIPDGPYRNPNRTFKISSISSIISNKKLRFAAFGYFGHMWELYTFWVFIPLILQFYLGKHSSTNINISLWSFIVIAIGALACILGGYLSEKIGSARTAILALIISGMSCVILPIALETEITFLFVSLMLVWGMGVIADSPQLSTLIANSASSELRGTALTLANCIGFSITIISIQALGSLIALYSSISPLTILAIGPILGIFSLVRFIRFKNLK